MRAVEPTIHSNPAERAAAPRKKASVVERAAPQQTNTLLWNLSSKTERRELLNASATKRPAADTNTTPPQVTPEPGSTLRKLAEQRPVVTLVGPEAPDEVTPEAPQGGGGFGGWAEGAAGWIGDKVDDARDQVTDAVDAGKDKANDAWDAGTEKIRQLVDDGRDRVVDKVRSAEEKARDLAGAGKDKVTDAWDAGTDKVRRIVDDGRDLVVDKVRSAEEKARDLANAAKDKVSDAWDRGRGIVADVVNDGEDKVQDTWAGARRIASTALDRRERIGDALLESATGVTSSIESLRPGDSLTITAGAEGGAGVVLQGGGGIEVEHHDDGTYTLSGEFEMLGGVGKGDFAALTAGAGARTEFRFDNLADAQQAAQALLKSSSPPVAIIGLSQAELNLLRNNVSAVEVSVIGQGQLDLRSGVSGLPPELLRQLPQLEGLQPGGAEWVGGGGVLQGDATVRVEFDEDGTPTALVERIDTDAAVDASVEGTHVQDLLERAGLALPDAVDGRYVSSFERRRTIGAGLQLGEPQYSASGHAEGTLDGRGWQLTVEAEPFTAAELLDRARDALSSGDPIGAAIAAGAELTVTHNTFTDESRGWLDNEVGIVVASAEGENVIRRNDPATVVSLADHLD